MKLKALVLTDHADHTAENSLYGLLKALVEHPQIDAVDVATRHNPLNERFFIDQFGEKLFVSAVRADFEFDEQGTSFFQDLHPAALDDYDFVLLRLPPPLNQPLLDFLKRKAQRPVFVNDPQGIKVVGNKQFLLNFQDLCPPMELLRSVEEIQIFSEQFPVVLKPLNNYGGKGILRVEDGAVVEDGAHIPLETYFESRNLEPIEYLGMQFLKNVVQGDKRILVVDGKVMGASLRLPKKGDWLCNVSQGGISQPTDLEPEEFEIVKRLNPVLKEHGIIIYGVDTLVNDEGHRVLSELNTTSIGGIKQIEQYTGTPVLKDTADRIIQYAIKRKYERYKLSA